MVLPFENRHTSFPGNDHDGRTVHCKLFEKGVGIRADNPPIHPFDGRILPKNSIHNSINARIRLATILFTNYAPLARAKSPHATEVIQL